MKNCLEMDIKANKEYVIERAKMEHPGYKVDYSDDANWEERVSPTVKAIEELKELKSKGIVCNIVWLTRPIDNDRCDYDYDFESCEAIVIREYLGSYDLIKIM